jgi:ferritin-like metal-binding protein YciE
VRRLSISLGLTLAVLGPAPALAGEPAPAQASAPLIEARVPGKDLSDAGTPRGAGNNREDRMFERLNTPQEAYNFELGAALKMEHTVLEMLEKLGNTARDEKLKQLFRHHHHETQQHIAHIERIFETFGWEVEESPSHVAEALDKDARATIKKMGKSLVSSGLLQAALKTEHHEIAVYENLIVSAEALGKDDVVALLRENLMQEQRMLEHAGQMLREALATTAEQAA